MKDFILLIPYFNDLEGLIASLKSISYPTGEFEILVVDDGSKTSLNADLLKTKFPSISITVLNMPANGGVAKALNAGLKSIHSRKGFKYIARLDCGDTCTKERFTEQVKFMNDHSEIGLLGTWCQFKDSASGKSYLYKTKTSHDDILKEMHFKCSFIHPTVMFKSEILETIGYYPENYAHAEDYAYFWEILKSYKGEILPEVNVCIVMNTKTISAKYFKKQILSRIEIIKNFGNITSLKLEGILLNYMRILIPIRFMQKIKLLLYK
ncbi:MAG TPA: glycosyltransferase [Bacteroidia bacterium]|nr:glycosyltransferase [Bacteroidia bacterium]